MSRELVSIDPDVLDAVTGGKANSSSGSGNIDDLLGQLNSITSSIKDIKTKTNGLGSSEMFMLVALALQNRPPANVVYVGPRRGRW
jgi:hypothetical protein